jgi:hypothetical protein
MLYGFLATALICVAFAVRETRKRAATFTPEERAREAEELQPRADMIRVWIRGMLILTALGASAFALLAWSGDGEPCQPATIGTIMTMATCAR